MQTVRDIAIGAIRDNDIVTIEILRTLLGELIGEGAYRYVFDDPNNSKQVIKIDMGDANANVTEFNLWNDIRHIKHVARWFCPVVNMSRCGRLLIMKKADMHAPLSRYPKNIPDFFDDVKRQNFGFVAGRLVCVDYGIHNMHIKGANVKLIKAIW